MSKAIACPNCFSNGGFRQAVANHAEVREAVCPRCSAAGPLIDRVKLKEAMHAFFVTGSFLAETIAPVYEVNYCNPHPAKFDATLDVKRFEVDLLDD